MHAIVRLVSTGTHVPINEIVKTLINWMSDVKITLFGWICMLNGFVTLNTLNKNGKLLIPPMSALSRSITFEMGSPLDFTVDVPLTWSPILWDESILPTITIKIYLISKEDEFSYQSSAYGVFSSNCLENASSFFNASCDTFDWLPAVPHSYVLIDPKISIV